MAPPENSVTNSRADCVLTQQMVGCIKAISPCVKSASAKLFLDLHTVLAPSGEERTLGEAAQVERAAWCCGQRNRNTPTRCVGVFLTWSWSQQPEGRACAASPALRDTLIRTP